MKRFFYNILDMAAACWASLAILAGSMKKKSTKKLVVEDHTTKEPIAEQLV